MVSEAFSAPALTRDMNVEFQLLYSAEPKAAPILRKLRLRSRSTTLHTILHKAVEPYLPWDLCLAIKDVCMTDMQIALNQREDSGSRRYLAYLDEHGFREYCCVWPHESRSNFRGLRSMRPHDSQDQYFGIKNW